MEGLVHLRHLGPPPLIEDDSLCDKGSNVANLRGAFKPGRTELYTEVFNLFGSRRTSPIFKSPSSQPSTSPPSKAV